MNEERLMPLEPEIDALLEAERRATGMPDDVDGRLRSVLAPFLLPPGGGGGADGGGSPSSGSDGSPIESGAGPATGGSASTSASAASTAGGGVATGAAASATSGALIAGSTSAATALGSLPALAVAFGLGLASGVGIHALVAPTMVDQEVIVDTNFTRDQRSEASTVLPEPVVPPDDQSAIDVEPADPEATQRQEVDSGPASQPSKRGGGGVSQGGTLSGERALLERARTALARRAPGAALNALNEHSRTYPRGRLAEEREALMIQALVAGGRYQAARRRAEHFARAYPGSLFRSSVNAVLSSIPDSGSP